MKRINFRKNRFLQPFHFLLLVSYKHDSDDDDEVCGRQKKKTLLVQKTDPDTMAMSEMIRDTNSLMDMLASLLLP